MHSRFWCYSSNDIFPIECCFCRITSAGIIIRHNIEAESKKNDTRVFRNYIKKAFFCCSTLRGLLPPKNLKRSCNLRQLDYENMIFFRIRHSTADFQVPFSPCARGRVLARSHPTTLQAD